MNWKKWLGKRLGGGGGCWVSKVVSLMSGCGKAGGCAASAGQADSGKQSTGSWISKVLMQGAKQVSAQNTQVAKLLDEVVAKLDAAGQAGSGSSPAGSTSSGGALLDAIDREIAAQPLQTAVARVRQSDVLAQFRQELETQSLTVTTVTAFLQLLQQVLPMLLVK
jgi:hypothetical protein